MPRILVADPLADDGLERLRRAGEVTVVSKLGEADLIARIPEFDALVDFAFNCGCGAFAGSTLLKLLNAGDYPGAAAQFDVWDHASGKVVAGLLRRREAETQEFATA